MKLSDPGSGFPDFPDGWTGLPDIREEILDDPAVLEWFTGRVEIMMRDQLDLLLSTLYRLDVEEYKIQHALHRSSEPPARAIARLILERQKERMRTRRQYGSSAKSGSDPDPAD